MGKGVGEGWGVQERVGGRRTGLLAALRGVEEVGGEKRENHFHFHFQFHTAVSLKKNCAVTHHTRKVLISPTHVFFSRVPITSLPSVPSCRYPPFPILRHPLNGRSGALSSSFSNPAAFFLRRWPLRDGKVTPRASLFLSPSHSPFCPPSAFLFFSQLSSSSQTPPLRSTLHR